MPPRDGSNHLDRSAFVCEGYKQRAIAAVKSIESGAVARAVECLAEARSRGSLVVLAGNGGSAATASHFVNDLVKATRVPGQPGFRAVCIADNGSLVTALANDVDYESVFSSQLDDLFQDSDVLVLISASGNSANIIAAAERAREIGGTIIGIVGFRGGRLAELADIVIHTRSDSDDYGPTEDVHLVLVHMMTECLRLLSQDQQASPLIQV